MNEPAAQTKTVVKALELLNCLSEAEGAMSAAELGKAVGLSRSTTYRLLRTLSSYGYVTGNFADSDKIQIGPRVLRLANAFLDRIEVRAVARPHLVALRDLSHENVYLVVPHQGQILHIDTIETPQPVRMYVPIGTLAFMHSTAVGKAILSVLSEGEVDAILRQHGLPRLTAGTITEPQTLKSHLKIVRAQGFGLSDIENEEGIVSVGVALISYSGTPVAGISISGPAYRFSADQAAAIAPDMACAAQAILDQLGLSASSGRGAT